MRPFPPPPPSFLSASSSSISSTSTSSTTTSLPTIRPSPSRKITSSLISNRDVKPRAVDDENAPAPPPKSKVQSQSQSLPQQPLRQPHHRRPQSPQKAKTRRPTSAFDDLFADILDALASSGLETDHPTGSGQARFHTAGSVRHRSGGRQAPGQGQRVEKEAVDEPHVQVQVQVHGELKKLKHSISERNLSNSARFKTDIQLLDRLIIAHRAEQLEMCDLKAELAAERELTRSLQLKLVEQEAKRAEEVDAMGKANRRALKVLMELQKEEYMSWAREVLEPNMEIIELGVRRRIANWERGKRERMVLKRQSSQVRNAQQQQQQLEQRQESQQQHKHVHPFARQSHITSEAQNESSPEEKGKNRPVTGIVVGGGTGGLVRRRSSVRGSWNTRKGSVRIKVEDARAGSGGGGGGTSAGGAGGGSLRYRERAAERERERELERQKSEQAEEWEEGDEGHPFVHALCEFLARDDFVLYSNNDAPE